ncbi:36ad15cc-8b47-4cf8-9edc-f4f167822e3f [Thermothielavioides terrestris]|uniref:36ad15cc-8b47-4cf8-9edc-f4f167822e3f n=1 Tax=Thermothielavioides terrestris TaxID=2587410 RepID=A0A446BH35_9PEZI|nr:36ad15cc-8b47-4cf8-9edc-f4f167822e3f [Thermothielavioides terrestris]
MDDLAGLNWSVPNRSQAQLAQSRSTPPNPAVPAYPSLRPTPSPFASGRSTPLSAQGSGNIAPKPPASTTAPDSFGNLLSFGAGKTNAKLSLRERQDQLEAEKRRKEEEQRKQAQAQYGDGSFFDSLGQTQSGSRSTPSSGALAPPPAAEPGFGMQSGKAAAESDDDLFAAFNADTKVDNSSYYPPPTHSSNPSPANAPGLDLTSPQSWNNAAVSSSGGGFGDDDDDPFGLGQLKATSSAPAPAPAAADLDEDDLLGDLGKPVDQIRKKSAPTFARGPEPGKPIEDSSSDSEVDQTAASDDPFDKAVAQLVDYGFTPENARRGLTESGGGLDVQAAVNWLLDDAHRQAKEQAKGRGGVSEQPGGGDERISSEPRQAVEDADTAIRLIGPGKGEGEHVELQGTGDSPAEKRDMRDLYGKALSRKAEALEQMEKWADAAAVWQLCVEAGLGGATAAAGRQRCQKALAPKPAPAPRPASTSPAALTTRPKATATPTSQKSSEAVQRLRAAHKAAEKEGDERIALTDKVDARIAAWRDGKRDNLRALLSSLDSVLWEGSGWKKVGLHELVVPNKVKVVYMKAIAKTHPDKIAQDATTEVRMIAATVFSTLNEAWDKFKAENNID